MTDTKDLHYKFFYWGPLLFKIHLTFEDLKKCTQLCSKKSSSVSDTLAGVIEHQHYISSHEYAEIIDPYLNSFRSCYHQWYGKPLTNPIQVTMAWVNFMKAGDFNPPHFHSNCDFSSVLFIKVPEKLKEENKKFTGKGGGPGVITFMYGEKDPFSLSERNIFPEEGDLYIFPATLTHFVAPFKNKEERISIAANFKLE